MTLIDIEITDEMAEAACASLYLSWDKVNDDFKDMARAAMKRAIRAALAAATARNEGE